MIQDSDNWPVDETSQQSKCGNDHVESLRYVLFYINFDTCGNLAMLLANGVSNCLMSNFNSQIQEAGDGQALCKPLGGGSNVKFRRRFHFQTCNLKLS